MNCSGLGFKRRVTYFTHGAIYSVTLFTRK